MGQRALGLASARSPAYVECWLISMRALFQAFASVVRSWLNSVRGRPDAPQLEGKLCGSHDGETSQEEDRAGPNSDPAQASDATPATARIDDPEALAANDVVASACEEVAESRSTPPQTEPESPPARAATSQQPSDDNEGMAGDEVHPSLDNEPEPPLPHQEATSSDVCATGDALPAAPGGPGGSIGGLPSSQLGKAPASDPSSPAGTTESNQDTPPARDAGDDIGDGRERTAGRSSEDGPGDPTSDPTDGEHPHLTEVAKPLIAPHESIDRGAEALHEPAARVPEGEAASQPPEVPTTDEPNNFAGEARDETSVFPGETAVVSDTDDIEFTAVPLGPYENGPGTPCAGMMGLVKPTENTGGTKPVAHNDTVFAQVLKLVPRHEFESLARKHKSGRMSRSMTRWGQFVAMGMAQLTGRCSLRDIVSNLAAQSCKLYHLGVGVVTRSSLARVNAEKPWEMYEELHGRLLGRCQAKAPGHGYRFKAKLFSVDSTTIDLCLSAFPWAKFRRTKGAVKVHVGLDHEGYLPTFVRVTNGKTSDIEAARALTLPKGSIVAADRAYVDFAWIDSLISEGIHLVTRLKRGIKYGVVETREVNAKRGVTSDETIEFTSAKGRKQCPHRLRRIGYHDRKTGKDYVFLTTHFHLSAKTIADIYKSRWQVELFFK